MKIMEVLNKEFKELENKLSKSCKNFNEIKRLGEDIPSQKEDLINYWTELLKYFEGIYNEDIKNFKSKKSEIKDVQDTCKHRYDDSNERVDPYHSWNECIFCGKKIKY